MADDTRPSTIGEPLFWLKDDDGKFAPVCGLYEPVGDHEERHLRDMLGGQIPRQKTLYKWHLTFPDYGPERWRQYHGWHVELVGLDVSNQARPRGPFIISNTALMATTRELITEKTRVLLQRATHGDNPQVFAEVRWTTSGQALPSIRWLSPEVPEPDELARASRGIQLLHHINVNLSNQGGKQPGDGATWDSNQAFLRDLDDAVRACQKSSGRKLLDAQTVRRRLNIQKTAFYVWVTRATGKRWREVAADYAAGRSYAELNGIGAPDNGR